MTQQNYSVIFALLTDGSIAEVPVASTAVGAGTLDRIVGALRHAGIDTAKTTRVEAWGEPVANSPAAAHRVGCNYIWNGNAGSDMTAMVDAFRLAGLRFDSYLRPEFRELA
jgi:hypothetical protein